METEALPTLLDFFFHPVLRAPTISCILIGLTASLLGVLLYLQKQSLLSETLSHASYPGITFSTIIASTFFPLGNHTYPVMALFLCGAFCSAYLGYWCVHWIQSRPYISPDTALCFVLSSFFGIGLMVASHVQFTHTAYYKQINAYIFGQAATMTDLHSIFYTALALVVISFIFIFFKELQLLTFDKEFAKVTGIRHRLVENLLFFFIVFTIVSGIRSVGVVLMSALLIAPVLAARQLTHRLGVLFVLSAIFGSLSGFLGNYLSFVLPTFFNHTHPVMLPTGPMVVLVAAAICTIVLIIAPEKGLFARAWRLFRFRYRCTQENILKSIWKLSKQQPVSLIKLAQIHTSPQWMLRWILRKLRKTGWVQFSKPCHYRLTQDGENRATYLVRLHRLWEVYLTQCIGMGAERVHASAEEMEHIITPKLEKELTQLLRNPTKDPHHQPIPPSPLYREEQT